MNTIKEFYWNSPKEIIDFISEKYSGKKVLDIGAGRRPLKIATSIVDIVDRFNYNGSKFYKIDVCEEPLPFKDNEFDFVYCSQMLEDTYNPVYVCREMARVGKAGYIENPSVIQEFCRLNKEGANVLCRGHGHHLYFIWYVNNALHLLPKYPSVEHINATNEKFIYDLLNKDFVCWHNCFFWENSFSIKFYRNCLDYDINRDTSTYCNIIQSAMTQSAHNSSKFYSKLIQEEVVSNANKIKDIV